MDLLSLVGVALAFAALIGGNWLEGGQLSMLANGPALVIVLGGSLGAVMLQTPMESFVRAIRISRYVFLPPAFPIEGMLEQLVQWSNQARKEGLLGLENAAELVPDPFLRKGMQLLVDGSEPEELRHSLELELESNEQRDLMAARVFESMGGYSPTIGIIGAVMGLIHVMHNLADPSLLGEGIATAFVATIYGVGLANLFMLPIANKLKSYTLARSHYREMVIEGLVAISEGENPRMLETRLQGFLQ